MSEEWLGNDDDQLYHETLVELKPFLNKGNVQDINRIILSDRAKKFKNIRLRSILSEFKRKKMKNKNPVRRSRSLTCLNNNSHQSKQRVHWQDELGIEASDVESVNTQLNFDVNSGSGSSDNTDDIIRSDFLYKDISILPEKNEAKQLKIFERLYSMESKYHSSLANIQSKYEQEIININNKRKIDSDSYKEEKNELKMKLELEILNLQNELRIANENLQCLKHHSFKNIESIEQEYKNQESKLKKDFEEKLSNVEGELISKHASEVSTLREEINRRVNDLIEQLDTKVSELHDTVEQLEKERSSSALAIERMQHAQTKLQQTTVIMEDLREQYEEARQRWTHLEIVNKKMLEQSAEDQDHMRKNYESSLNKIKISKTEAEKQWSMERDQLKNQLVESQSNLEKCMEDLNKTQNELKLKISDYKSKVYSDVLKKQDDILNILKTESQKNGTNIASLKNERCKLSEMASQQATFVEGQFKILHQTLNDIHKKVKLIQSPSESLKVISSVINDSLRAYEVSKNTDCFENLRNQLENATTEVYMLRERCRNLEGEVRTKNDQISTLKSEHLKEIDLLIDKEKKIAKDLAEEQINKTRKTLVNERALQSQTVQDLINKMNIKFNKLESEYQKRSDSLENKLKESKNMLQSSLRKMEDQKSLNEAEREEIIKTNEITLTRMQTEHEIHCTKLKDTIIKLEKRLLHTEKRLLDEEREHNEKISKLQMAYSRELTSLLPVETQLHLQNTIQSLRAQVQILEKRLDGQNLKLIPCAMNHILSQPNLIDVATQLTDKNPFSSDSKIWISSGQDNYVMPQISLINSFQDKAN